MKTMFSVVKRKGLSFLCDSSLGIPLGSIVALITRVCFLYQGGDLARRSVLLNGDAHLTHFYDDAKTLYEFFLRGARVSSKSQAFTGSITASSHHYKHCSFTAVQNHVCVFPKTGVLYVSSSVVRRCLKIETVLFT